MRRWSLLVFTIAVLIAAAFAWRAARLRAPAALPATSLSLLEVLGARADDVGFERALEPREMVFPRDHGPHPGFRTEWWYWTGNLAAADGRRFGYQLTMFRSALGRPEQERESAWATHQAYMAHFTVTEVTGDAFHAFQRLARGAVGLAGATSDPFGAWVLDWSASSEPGQDGAPHVRLRAAEAGLAIDLDLAEGKAPVLQGNAGLSQKGARPGNASYYYSLTRMPTRGTVTAAGSTVQVEGSSWMDREWSTSALEEGQTGWDWFALQLDDGTDLMFFRLRREGGGVDPHSHGSVVSASGQVTPLASESVRIDVLRTWRSERSGATYPSHFRLAVGAGDTPIDLEITPARDDQELDLSFRYWEGAVVVRGHHGARPVQGRGYVELTGYDRGSQK